MEDKTAHLSIFKELKPFSTKQEQNFHSISQSPRWESQLSEHYSQKRSKRNLEQPFYEKKVMKKDMDETSRIEKLKKYNRKNVDIM